MFFLDFRQKQIATVTVIKKRMGLNIQVIAIRKKSKTIEEKLYLYSFYWEIFLFSK
jgi:hypothetical protein